MKKGLFILVAAFVLMDIAGGGRSTGGCGGGSKSGKVLGIVTFSGLNCQPGQPDFNVPPCTGPYPNYKIEVYKDDGKTLALTAMTNSKGNYSIELPDGNYVIYTQNGPMENNRKEQPFRISGGRVVNLDLNVSTGIQ